MFIPGEIIALYSMQQEREYSNFCTSQYSKGNHIPARDQYFLAKHIAYAIEHPPKQAWYKTCAAVIIKKLFKL